MDPERLRQLLQQVAGGDVSAEDALRRLETLPFADLGYARVDHHRHLRMGLPEVVLGDGKTGEHIVGIARRLIEAGQNVLVTRVGQDKAEQVRAELPQLSHHATARTLTFEHRPIEPKPGQPVAVVTAGTSDIPVAEEALETLRVCGIPHRRLFDVGVAGIHRIFAEAEELTRAPAVIVVAGMEGALPSVVGGFVGAPVIAVPTSVGYGASLGGLTALMGMLSGCASGVTVVNIDNGFGAAVAVARIWAVRHEAGVAARGTP